MTLCEFNVTPCCDIKIEVFQRITSALFIYILHKKRKKYHRKTFGHNRTRIILYFIVIKKKKKKSQEEQKKEYDLNDCVHKNLCHHDHNNIQYNIYIKYIYADITNGNVFRIRFPR